MRSLGSNSIGGQTLPAFGQCGSIIAHSVDHGTSDFVLIGGSTAADRLGIAPACGGDEEGYRFFVIGHKTSTE